MSVLIYNQGGVEPLNTVPLKHAINMLHKGTAIVHEAIEGKMFGKYQVPKSVQLVKYVFAKWKYQTTGRVPFKKIGVLKRDKFTCAYCGLKNAKKVTTVDHIIPKSRGGQLSWNNLVAACKPCNGKKANRTPKEAGMPLRFVPRTLSFDEAYTLTH